MSFSLASETGIATTEEITSLINNPPQTEEERIKAWEKYIKWRKLQALKNESVNNHIVENAYKLVPLLLGKKPSDTSQLPTNMEWRTMQLKSPYGTLQQKVYPPNIEKKAFIEKKALVEDFELFTNCAEYKDLAKRNGLEVQFKNTADHVNNHYYTNSRELCVCFKADFIKLSENSTEAAKNFNYYKIRYDHKPCHEMRETDDLPKKLRTKNNHDGKCDNFKEEAKAKGWQVGYPSYLTNEEPCQCYKAFKAVTSVRRKNKTFYNVNAMTDKPKSSFCGENRPDAIHVKYSTRYKQIPCGDINKVSSTDGMILNDDNVCVNCAIGEVQEYVHPEMKGKTFCGEGNDSDTCFTCPGDETETEAKGVCIECTNTIQEAPHGSTSATLKVLSELSDDPSFTSFSDSSGSSSGGGFFSSIGSFFSSLFSPFKGLGSLLFPFRSFFFSPTPPVSAYPYNSKENHRR